MPIHFTVRHDDVPESVKEYARAKVEKLTRTFGRVRGARITLDGGPLSHRAEILLEVGRGVTLVGKATAPEMFAAIDLAEQRLAGQLRRHKERRTDHGRGQRRAAGERRGGALGAGAAAEGTGATRSYEEVIERLAQGE